MGQITVNIPQHHEFDFRIVDKDAAERVLVNLREMIKQANAVGAGEVLGIWADSYTDLTAAELAGRIRQSWKRKLING